MLNSKQIASSERHRILLAEDMPEFVRLFRYYFKNFEIVHCLNAADAFEQYQKTPFAAVITDNDMKVDFGLTLVKKIRAIDLDKLIVVYSGDDQTKETYLKEGANRFFKKNEIKELTDFVLSTLPF